MKLINQLTTKETEKEARFTQLTDLFSESTVGSL